MLKLRIQLFADGGLTPEQQAEKDAAELQLAQLNAMKEKMESMVDNAQYEALKKQYDTLLNDYVNKRPVPKAPTEPIKLSPKELAEKMNSGKLTKREYAKTSLEYREAFKAKHNVDPWVGGGVEEAEAEAVANHIKSLLDTYESDSEFTYRFDNSLVDDPNITSKLRAKK